MRAEIAKNKFSEIGLASSKGISSKDPIRYIDAVHFLGLIGII